MGEVNNPGWINAPDGITALGAIKRAGGFVRIGASREVRITRGTTIFVYLLAMEPLGPESPNEYRIWYAPFEWSKTRRREVIDRHWRSDVVLQDGDKVLVPGGM
jgi:protein involved in polysaccharide export with SLBB domain